MPHAKPDLSRQAEMAELILQLAPQEGHTRSLLDGVRLMRADRPLGRTPVLYEPSIVIVCQGHKRGYLANRIYHYDPQHYLRCRCHCRSPPKPMPARRSLCWRCRYG